MIASRHTLIMVLGGMLVACGHGPHVDGRPVRRDRYQLPLSSPGAQFAALTPPVQNAIRAQVGGAEISRILKDARTGRVDVYFVNSARFPPLHIAADGSILRPDFAVAVGAPSDESLALVGGSASGLKPGELPQAVQSTLQQQAPDAPIASISKETWGNQPVYIITFAPGSGQPRLYVSAEGAVLHRAP